jgi:two-component system chemotaxis response regulator CheB
MWEIDEGNLTRYRCHVGHTYSPDLMRVGLDEGLRRALGSAQRALEERIALASRLHQRAVSSGHRLLAQTWAARARESERDAEIIRESLRKIDCIVAREQLQAQHDPSSSVRSAEG